MLSLLSKIPASTLIGKFLRIPLKILPKNLVVPILSGVLRGKKWIIGSGNHGYWIGIYEHEKQKAFSNSLHEDSVVYDIGANVGFYTLISAYITGLSGKVFAFEPSSRNCRYLRTHLDLNGVKNVTILEAAVSDYSGQGFFDRSDDSFQGKLAENGTPVKVVSLDTLVQKKKILPPDVMKIDVEGGELRVLKGSEQLLRRYSPNIFLATHGGDVHSACVEYLLSIGYSVRSLRKYSIKFTDELIATKELKR